MALDASLTPAGRTGRSAARLGFVALATASVSLGILAFGHTSTDVILAMTCKNLGRILLGVSSVVAVWGLVVGANAATLVIPGTPPDPGRFWVHAGLTLSGLPILVVVGYVVFISVNDPN